MEKTYFEEKIFVYPEFGTERKYSPCCLSRFLDNFITPQGYFLSVEFLLLFLGVLAAVFFFFFYLVTKPPLWNLKLQQGEIIFFQHTICLAHKMVKNHLAYCIAPVV